MIEMKSLTLNQQERKAPRVREYYVYMLAFVSDMSAHIQ